MRCRLIGPVTLLLAALAASTGRAEIAWTYAKPSSERSVGSLLSDILGLSEFGKDYAVIIGLHRFEDFNPLDATENDPQRVFEFLRDEAGFDYILMLRDEEVAYQRLRSLFAFELPRVLGSNDRFLLYWSGHGTQFPDARGVELGYLPLVSSPADDKSTMVAMRDLAEWDNELPAKHVLFLLDACFSGLAGSTAQSDERDLEIRELAKPGHHIISAGGRDQQTLASRQEWQGSIFTNALLKALRGDADRYGGKGEGDGVINLYELVADIGETVKNAKAAAGWRRPLRPVLNVFRGEGQFFFLTSERKRTYLEAQGKHVSEKLAYGMPVVAMGATNEPDDPGSERGTRDLGEDFQVWSLIKDSSNPTDLETFIEAFPESVWVAFARNRLAKVRPGPLDTAALSKPEAAASEPEPATIQDSLEVTLGPRPGNIQAVQRGLAALGFDAGRADGELGPKTRGAIKVWQEKRNYEPTGYLTPSQYDRLLAEAQPKLALLESARKAERATQVQPAVGIFGYQPGDEFRDCPECPEMVVVPAGQFVMGSPPDEPGRLDDEGPQHNVTISRPFAVGKTEVTFAEWDACLAEGECGSTTKAKGGRTDDRPIINVSWDDAQDYVKWVSAKTGKTYRLLSEAEWEYVARAGSATAYWWGQDVGSNKANCSGCGSQWDGQRTAPVGSFDPNAFGLHDTAGNVWEWTEDCWHKSYRGAPEDGSAWATNEDCGQRVRRSGAYGLDPSTLRSADRFRLHPANRYDDVGFRVARTID